MGQGYKVPGSSGMASGPVIEPGLEAERAEPHRKPGGQLEQGPWGTMALGIIGGRTLSQGISWHPAIILKETATKIIVEALFSYY